MVRLIRKPRYGPTKLDMRGGRTLRAPNRATRYVSNLRRNV
jgi:hypothetical protein